MISLIPGKFQLKVEYKDLNTNNLNKSTATTANFEITPLTEELINISNIQIADYISKTKEKNVLSKYGYDVLPHLGNYFSEECNTLPIYLELYNINLDTNLYFLTYQITEKVSKDELYFLKDTIGLKVKEIHPIIKGIDIHNLVTGEYRLIINLKNQKGDTISSSKFDFYRNNDLASISSSKNIILDPAFQKSLPTDSLYFFAKSLMPIIYNDDQKILLKLLKEKDTSKLRVFIQSFWQITAKDKKPYDVWITYKNQVLLIEKLYKTHNIHGFETERGRVYLKYGPPTAINARESSPSEYPYEIWQYNKIKTFSNKRFVFYNPDIVGNNYRLLHSDLNGEIKNFKWPGMLRKRNNSTTNVDDPLEGGFDHFGGESTEVYNQY
jgi:GWxTD domain-containing protein